jgi:hypothetical protein
MIDHESRSSFLNNISSPTASSHKGKMIALKFKSLAPTPVATKEEISRRFSETKNLPHRDELETHILTD